MSANLLVDIHGGANFKVSVATPATISPASGIVVGQIVDFNDEDTYCNAFIAGGPDAESVAVKIQTSDSTASGTFTDPTSGLGTNDLPANVLSGGRLVANSAIAVSGRGPHESPLSGVRPFASGGIEFGAFQRPHRYARLILESGTFAEPVLAGFVSQRRTTGSGGGFSFQPGSGTVNV